MTALVNLVPGLAEASTPAEVCFVVAMISERGWHMPGVTAELRMVANMCFGDFMAMAKLRGWKGDRRLKEALRQQRVTPRGMRIAAEIAGHLSAAEFAVVMERHRRAAAYWASPSDGAFLAMRASPTIDLRPKQVVDEVRVIEIDSNRAEMGANHRRTDTMTTTTEAAGTVVALLRRQLAGEPLPAYQTAEADATRDALQTLTNRASTDDLVRIGCAALHLLLEVWGSHLQAERASTLAQMASMSGTASGATGGQ